MRTLLAALFLATAPIAAHAADISVQGDVLTFHGYIAMGDAVRFHINLMAADSAGLPIRTVRLNSPGGLVDEATQIARDVRQRGLDTVVTKAGICASACFLPFAAGKAKLVEDDARVGVHSAALVTGQESEAGTLGMAMFAKGLGVPDFILARMTAESNSEMAWLSAAELRTMGATVTKVTMMNAWTLQGTEKYDEKASAAAQTVLEGQARSKSTVEMKAAVARFEASPLHAAIMGR